MEQKLLELYGNCQVLENGSYYVKTQNGNELFIPATISQNQSLIAYAPGSGGSGNDAVRLRNMCKSENPPTTVVAIAPSCSDNQNIIEIGTTAITNLGGQVDNAVYASFSASGIKGLQQGEVYLQNHPDVSLSIVSCDGCGTYGGMSDKYPTIKESETPFIIISGNNRYEAAYKKMDEAGYNAYYLKVNNGSKVGHIQLNKDMIDYLLLYTVGELDEIPENDLQYALYKSTFDQTVDFENMRCSGAGSTVGYNKNVYKSVLKLGNLGFNNLDKYNDTEKIGNGYVKADFHYIQSSLNTIRQTISKANIATKTPALPVAGAGGLLSAITACIDKYSTMTVSLYTKLAQETEATASYAQSIIDLDLQQKGQLNNINNGTIQNEQTGTNTGTTTGTQNQTGTNTGTNTQTGTNTGTNNQTTGNTNTGNTNTGNTGGNTGGNTNTGGNSNTGGGSNNGGGYIPPVVPPTEPTTPTVTNPIIDGNNMTWKYADGHNLTLTVENGTVTAMKFTYTYDSVNDLNKNISNILVGQIDKQYFDKMTIIDKTVEVTIKQDYFKSLSLDKIKELFFKGGIS